MYLSSILVGSLVFVTWKSMTVLYLRGIVLVRWLLYHDKDTGNLMGTLPLAIGMRGLDRAH